MSRQISASVDNTFIKGLITEATGLNFPDNACTDCENCEFSLLGDISRRPGLGFEPNFATTAIIADDRAITTYKWTNAGGDGQTQILVLQIGELLRFYKYSAATVSSPMSVQLLPTTVSLFGFLINAASPTTQECQFSDGNGYLFVYHPYCDPFYLTYSAGVITGSRIGIKIRDFVGLPEPGLGVDIRPATLGTEHAYNLSNQGWTQGAPWVTASSTPFVVKTGSVTLSVNSGMSATNGDAAIIAVEFYGPVMSGTVTAYAGSTMTINVTNILNASLSGASFPGAVYIITTSSGYINTWVAAAGNYPSNSDVWWTFKNTSDVFAPATTINNVSLKSGRAPRGHFILDAFSQNRNLVSGIPGPELVFTSLRPSTGAWFAGRVWYAGLDDSFTPTIDAGHYSWTENIYFSQIVSSNEEFGYCYQNNDPTAEDAADLLPSDGGVIQIQGCGKIHKLFPVQNGLLVFAAKGIWFITGSQGIGFTANDYTVTKISSIRTLSHTSFVNVQGYPMFWNDEGIYSVAPNQNNSLSVDNLCLGTILTFFNEIPLISKQYARGDFDPLSYTVTWIYRDIKETSISDRYVYNSGLNFNTANKAFSPDTFLSTKEFIRNIVYIPFTAGINSPEPTFKFLVNGATNYTFAEKNDFTNWVDFYSLDNVGADYSSFFETGYKLKGGALHRWQPLYVYVFSKNAPTTSYKIQGIWDYAITGNSGRFSQQQVFYNDDPDASVSYRRHKIRGHGRSLQLKYTSVSGQPFTIIGWAIQESSNSTV